MSSATTILTALALSTCCLVTGTALAQPQQTANDRSADDVDEEIVVRGRSRAALRAEIQAAEEALYARWNEINSDDEFDIHCRLELLTGSRIRRRVCQANFWRDALSRAGTETARALKGEAAIAPQNFLAEALYKGGLLEEEMQRLAREDETFLKTVVRLANLTEASDSRRMPRAAIEGTGTLREWVAREDELPYGAAAIYEVRIDRTAWMHTLSWPTFAIADVYGEIRSIELRCPDRIEQLSWEEGAEWTVPEGWLSCPVRVQAARGTTFALYEFD
jgi:hypothetical protein